MRRSAKTHRVILELIKAGDAEQAGEREQAGALALDAEQAEPQGEKQGRGQEPARRTRN